MYTLILNPDNTYEVQIDGEKAEGGDLESDWDFLPAKKIKDPDAKKPDDWDENEYIDDPEDKKPDDWEKPEHIPDPEAKKPEDWDDEMDGEWEPPMIDNPEYKGEWKPKQIKNPEYKVSNCCLIIFAICLLEVDAFFGTYFVALWKFDVEIC